MEPAVFNRKSMILVIIASLGYFVDIYDLVLFGVVKAESLTTIMPGATDSLRASTGKMLFNLQMIGMFVGGLLWGVLGDKKGRIKVLFGSILLYSLANIANAFVTNIPSYSVIRFIAGVGLAGELGAGITLVSELMPREKRGYGTMIIVCFGAMGAVFATLIGTRGDALGQWIESVFGASVHNWQVAYLVGGFLGLILLLLRMRTLESDMFNTMHEKGIRRGDLKLIFSNKKNLKKYFHCILVGVPIWFVVGLLIMNSKDDFGPLHGLNTVNNGYAVMYAYIGLSIGDLVAGFLSQWLKSRRKVVFIFLFLTLIVTISFLFAYHLMTLETYYFFCFLLGTSTGYWAIFVTIAAEQFGTNIRSTAANTIPNFVRGSVFLIVSLFLMMNVLLPTAYAALLVGLTCLALAFWGIFSLRETFSKDLNYHE
ncbi:MAG: MFS transporter [Bacteroidetes bacterium]|nr:MFS transporter [Bacteroidota bacterium]MBM3424689.1 MFS transporter [Bacteroidota bacterium]